jgi:exosortase
MLGKAVSIGKKYYQYILASALITLLVIIVYGADLTILANEALTDETLSYILLVPFFAAILFYLKKDVVKAQLALEKQKKKTVAKHVDELVGAVVCIVAFLVYWYGSHTFYPLEYQILSLPIFLFGVTLILFNLKATLMLLAPILFLFFLVPAPMEVVYSLGGAMGNFNTQVAYTLLRAFHLPVTLSTAYGPPTLMLTSIHGAPASFTVDLPCSGIYSLIAFAMFAAFLALVTAGPIIKKTIVVLFGSAMFEVLNVVRITAIVSIAYQFGQEIAMNLFHAWAGILLIFAGMLLTLFFADKVLKIQVVPTMQEQAPCSSCETNLRKLQTFCSNCGRPLNSLKTSVSKEFWAKLLLLMLLCFIMTLSVNAPTFAIAQGPKGITYSENWTSSANAFPNITGYQPPEFLYRDTAYEQIAGQDANLWYSYFSQNSSNPIVYVDVGVADTISNLHNWEVCLVSWQIAQGQSALVTVLDARDVELLPDIPLVAQYFTFTSPENYTQVTLYWYERATFNMGVTVEQKYVRISLVVLTGNSTNSGQIEDQLLPMGQAIASYWQPMQNSSLISLGIPTLQALLIAAIAIIVFTKTSQEIAQTRKNNINRKLFNHLASQPEKTMLQTIQEVAAGRKMITAMDIKEAIERNTGESLSEGNLQRLLTHLEQYGFLRKDIVSVDNKPVMVWKA